MEIKEIKIERFKKVDTAIINVDKINILVGENNSGKSSILQAIHFHLVTSLARYSVGQEAFSSDQVIYNPSSDFRKLKHDGVYGNFKDPQNSSKIEINGKNDDDTDFKYEIEIRKGRNDGNISCTIKGDTKVGQLINNINNPFSIIVPGLAGIPIKEEYRSRAVILKAIACGESNLYLRNILYLAHSEGKLNEIILNLKEIFPDIDIAVEFDINSNANITTNINCDGRYLPMELVGTGILQAIQIFAYIAIFKPTLLLLDEPDSHLHPDNQRKLIYALKKISESYDTKIILSTHSKHLIDGFYGYANFIRIKNGRVTEQGSDLKRLSMLVDIGALDKYDKLKTGTIKAIILTEDSSKEYLEKLLEYNGFILNELVIISYNGITNMNSAIILMDFFKDISSDSKIVIHRDLDFMLDSEKEIIKKRIESVGAIPFFTQYSDIEAYFINSKHISFLVGVDESVIQEWINELATTYHTNIQHEYTRKRDDLKYLYKDDMTKWPDTLSLLGTHIPLEDSKRKGKTMIRIINGNMHKKFSKVVNLKERSDYLIYDDFELLKDAIK